MAESRQTFYVGGSYVQDEDGKHYMQGQMYVEHIVPISPDMLQPYPLVFIHGGTRTGAVSWTPSKEVQEKKLALQ